MRAIFFTAAILFAGYSQATSPSCPPVDERSINGTWEGLNAGEEFRYFKVELGESTGRLYQSTLPGHVIEAELIKREVGNGKFRLAFRYVGDMKRIIGLEVAIDGKKYVTSGVVLIEGEGKVCGAGEFGETFLNAKYVANHDLPNRVEWPVYFRSNKSESMLHRVNRVIGPVK